MSSTISKKDHWREVYLRQRLKNAHLWLEELERTSDPVALAAANYDKLLQAIEQTLKHEDSFSVGCDLLREVTPIAFGMADWGRLLVYLTGALSKIKRSSNRSNEAYLHEWIADIESSLFKLSEAEKNFHIALQLYLEEGEMVRYGRILPRLARVYASKGQLSRALGLCNDALRLGETTNEAIVIADALFGLGEIYFRSNDWQVTLDYCERASSKYKEVDKQSFIFKTKVLVITCKVSLKRYDEARVESDYLLQVFKNSENAYDNLYDSIQLRSVIGFMAFKQKDYVTAEQHWQAAYRQNTLVGAPDLAASIGNNLGKVYTILGEYEAAEEMLSEALVLFDQLGDVSRWANCMDNLVDLYEEKGDWAACKRTLEQAIARLEPEATVAPSHKLLQTMQQRLQNLPES
jgi:tetratricopeptide (TPR) repeat protein